MAPDLGLDLRLSATKFVSNFSKEASAIDDGEKRTAKLEEYIRILDDEKRKIEVFKRELPLCMFLLNDVIRGLKAELEQCPTERLPSGDILLEEFMPIKSKLDEDGGIKVEKDCKDKMNWMSSAQLWSDNYSDDNKNSKKNDKEKAEESNHKLENENPSLESKRGGAFVPFKGLSSSTLCCNSKKEDKEQTVGLPDLSLVPPAIKGSVSVVHEDQRTLGLSSKSIGRGHLASPASSHISLQGQQQGQRKARRCWSPELHRRFVVSLQQLGGAQVATPKQIRELMKVDGLTNDEVKSHLQKYRLHTRRVPNSSGSSANRQVVVMGGLWVPQDHYTTSSQQSGSQSGSPQGPLQLTGSSRAISVTANDSCEEDGKSESYSWK